MTNRLHLSAAAAVLFVLQPFATAQLSAAEGDQTAQSSDNKASDSKSDKKAEKKICHREVPTGSITPVRVCRTQAQIDADAERGQAQLDDMNRSSTHGNAR